MKKLDEFLEIYKLINYAKRDFKTGDLSSTEKLFEYSKDLKKWFSEIPPNYFLYNSPHDLIRDLNSFCNEIINDHYPTDYDIIEECINIIDNTHYKIGCADVENDEEYKQWNKLLSDLTKTKTKLKEIKDVWK